MARRHYNLPPFASLTAFEAAARHMSFKAAAAELSVTPGAVSHQIRALEADLGLALFHRAHRSVTLTEPGQQLFASLSQSFQTIAQSLDALRDNADQGVTVGATTAMASFWLSPAVLRFWRTHPDVTVNQTVKDQPFALSSALDFYIWYGPAPDPGAESFPLFQDKLVPVTAPSLAQSLKNLSLEDLASQRLIHQDGEHLTWTRWGDWFSRMGYQGPIAAGARVNNYTIALQSAQDGVGIALGWRHMIKPKIDAGDLIPLDHLSLVAPRQFHLVCRPAAELNNNARALRDWLLKEAKTTG